MKSKALASVCIASGDVADFKVRMSKRLFACVALSVFASHAACATEINVQNLNVQQVTCKANRITWKRPSFSAIPCGSIKKYRVYRNGALVSEMAPPVYLIDNGACGQADFTAPGDSGEDVNLVDEQSTHEYRVNVVDASGVEHETSTSYTATTSACPAGPYESRINLTLVTFSDVVNAGCASYPCVVQNLPDAPFTVEQARIDMYEGSGVTNDLPPLAWVVQQNAPNIQVTVTGNIFGWIILGPRSSYCSEPYGLFDCDHAHDRIVSDAIRARGALADRPRVDMFHVYGINGGPYATRGPYTMGADSPVVARALSFDKTPQRLRLYHSGLHEIGHVGLYDGVSIRLNAHSFSLRCPDGASIGSDLSDLSKDANGIAGRCLAFDYGDSECTMGNEPRLFNAIARRSLGLIGPDNVHTVLNTDEDMALIKLEHLNAPSSPTSSGKKIIRVALGPNPDDTSYILEYRGGDPFTLLQHQRELDYRSHCPGGVCIGVVPQGVRRPRGIYVRLKIRNPVDLGASNADAPGVPFGPNGSVQSLMLSREVAPGNFEPLFLDESNPSFTDPFRGVTFTLAGYVMSGGVDTALVRVERNPAGPAERPEN